MDNEFGFIKGSKKHVEQAIARYHNNIKWLQSRQDQKLLLIDLQKISNPPELVFDENNYANIQSGDAKLYEIKEQGSEEYHKKLSNEKLGFIHAKVNDVTQGEKFLSDLHVLKYNLFHELNGADPSTFKYINENLSNPTYEDKNIKSMLQENFIHSKLYKNAFIGTIVGVGLGYHMKEYMKRTNPSLVFICDVSNMYIFLSLFCVNYKSIFDHIPNGNFMIYTNANTQIVFNEYREFIYSKSRLAFYHAPLSIIKSNFFTNGFVSELGRNKISLYSLYGFFSDQLAMHANTAFNFKHGQTLITKRNYKKKNTPVFIIGSGPSINYDVDFIKANKDKALIVACGSSLNFLLSHNITPDFYVWLERDSSWHDGFINKNIDLSNVVLLAPLTTVGTKGLSRLTKVEQNFNTTLMRSIFSCEFKYEILSTRTTNAKIWDKQNDHTLSFEGTTVSNLALSFIEHFNFQNIYLFGLDFGKKGMLDHHVQEVTDEYSTTALEVVSDFLESTATNVPANFGGMTTTMHPYARGAKDVGLFLNEVNKEKTNVKVYNCSDGVHLTHTIATFSESIILEDLAQDKSKIIDDLYQEQQTIDPSYAQNKWKSVYVEDEVKVLLKNIREFYKNIDWSSPDIAQKYHEILNNPACLSQNLLEGNLYDTFVYGLSFMQKLKPEYAKKGRKIVTKYILRNIDAIELLASTLLTSLNVYLLRNEELPREQKKEVLIRFQNKFYDTNKNPLNVSQTYIDTKHISDATFLTTVAAKSKLKVMAESYNQYINSSTAINILSNGLRVPFVSLASKKKLLQILETWINKTQNETLIAKFQELSLKHFNASPKLTPYLDETSYICQVFSSDGIPTDYKQYFLKQLNLIDEYNSIEKLASIDIDNHEEMARLVDNLNCPKDHHSSMVKIEVLFDIIRKPMDVEEAQMLLFAEDFLPFVADHFLDNSTTSIKYNLLEEYYKLIEKHIDDETISPYERSNTMAMDWLLCPIIEEKVLDNSLDKAILSTDIYKQTFEVNKNIVHMVSNAEYFHYTVAWNAKFIFNTNINENISQIKHALKLNRLLLQEWKKFEL